jgi:peptide/nickel transport system ATP-binding protein
VNGPETKNRPEQGRGRPLLELRGISKYFAIRRLLRLRALSDINLTLYPGEKFGVVGESGSGKSTLGRVMLQLYPPSGGDCLYYGRSLTELCPRYLKGEIRRLVSVQKKAKRWTRRAERAGEGERREWAREQGRRRIQEGSKTAGSLILSKSLPRIARLFAEAFRETTRARRFLRAAAKLETRADRWERQGRPVPPPWRSRGAALRERGRAVAEAAEGLWREAFSLRGKDPDPAVSPLALEKEYRDKLDASYETGVNLGKLSGPEMRSLRSEMQLVFQDPSASLDPRQAVGKAIEEVFTIHHALPPDLRREKARALLERVGLRREHYRSFPNALSGGQKQRVCIARAIATDPRLVVLDESLSALDVSVQAQILGLLDELRADGRTYVFITHDLGVAKYFCHRIMVMYLGAECETAPSAELFAEPLHPYTRSLLAAIPRPVVREVDYEAPVLEGEVPNALYPPPGCLFHTRCKNRSPRCAQERPALREWKNNHFVACHLYGSPEEGPVPEERP